MTSSIRFGHSYLPIPNDKKTADLYVRHLKENLKVSHAEAHEITFAPGVKKWHVLDDQGNKELTRYKQGGSEHLAIRQAVDDLAKEDIYGAAPALGAIKKIHFVLDKLVERTIDAPANREFKALLQDILHYSCPVQVEHLSEKFKKKLGIS